MFVTGGLGPTTDDFTRELISEWSGLPLEFHEPSWNTMGLGESDVAHLTELCLDGIKIEKGYRVHIPYVEVKLTFLASQLESLKPAIQKVEEALHDITITRNGEDVPSLIAKKLTRVNKLQVVDALSGQTLLNRLSPALRDFMNKGTGTATWSFSNHNNFSNDLNTDPQELKMLLKA